MSPFIVTSVKKEFDLRSICRVCASFSIICLVIVTLRHVVTHDQSAVELSMRMRGNPQLQSAGAQATSGDVHTTASRHASTPLALSPDIAAALGKADSVIRNAQPLLAKSSRAGHNGQMHQASMSPQFAHAAISGNAHASAQHHSSPPAPQETPQEIAKDKEESELWNTEQAMKRALDAQTAHKSGTLWQHTVKIVHRTDPNANLISKLNSHESPEQTGEEKESALKRVQSKTDTMKEQLKAELDAKTKNDMGRMEDKTVDLQKRVLDREAHDSKAAETANAHRGMPLTDMKKMLKSQLDNSVSSVVKRAKQLQGFSSDTELEKRLKAELDAKAKAQEKQLLVSQRAKQSLVLARRKLHGRVSRAAKVRLQLSKEMREENAIRKQLDLQAEQAGKRMLQRELSPAQSPAAKAAAPHEASRADLEHELRRRLDSKDKQLLRSSAPAPAPARRRGAKTAAMEREVEAKLHGAQPGNAHDLQDYLRKQLDATDRARQRTLYRHAVQGHLLKRIRKGGAGGGGGGGGAAAQKAAGGPAGVLAKNRELHDAAMRLFRTSMRRAEGKKQAGGGGGGADGHGGAASAASGGHADSATAALLRQALKGPHGGGGERPFAALHREEAQEHQAAAARPADVPTAIEQVMDGTLARARGVRPFAALHKDGGGGDDGEVHDMAHASQHSTLSAAGAAGGPLDGVVLGHLRALRDADATAAEVRQARAKTVKEAQKEEEEAVE